LECTKLGKLSLPDVTRCLATYNLVAVPVVDPTYRVTYPEASLLNDRDATTIPLHDLSRFRRTRV